MWCILYVCFYVERGQKTVCLVYCGAYAYVFIFCEISRAWTTCAVETRGDGWWGLVTSHDSWCGVYARARVHASSTTTDDERRWTTGDERRRETTWDDGIRARDDDGRRTRRDDR